MKLATKNAARPKVTMYVCTTCTAESKELLDYFGAMIEEADIRGVDCMSGCTNAQTVAFRAKGKTAYLFGEITEKDSTLLQNFVRLYAQSPDGTFEDARVLGTLRTKAIARIPG